MKMLMYLFLQKSQWGSSRPLIFGFFLPMFNFKAFRKSLNWILLILFYFLSNYHIFESEIRLDHVGDAHWPARGTRKTYFSLAELGGNNQRCTSSYEPYAMSLIALTYVWLPQPTYGSRSFLDTSGHSYRSKVWPWDALSFKWR